MSLKDQPTEQLQDVRHIRDLMERSSRFLSLSGFSGIAAGVCALAGAGVAYNYLRGYLGAGQEVRLTQGEFNELQLKLIILAAVVFMAAVGSAFYFTYRRTRQEGVVLWNVTSRRLFWNVAIPIVAGGLFIAGMLFHDEWRFIGPASLFFYGLALINASKYTLSDIRFLGISEVALGFISMFWIGYGLYFWAAGFGLLHIIYGISMWYKYERK